MFEIVRPPSIRTDICRNIPLGAPEYYTVIRVVEVLLRVIVISSKFTASLLFATFSQTSVFILAALGISSCKKL